MPLNKRLLSKKRVVPKNLYSRGADVASASNLHSHQGSYFESAMTNNFIQNYGVVESNIDVHETRQLLLSKDDKVPFPKSSNRYQTNESLLPKLSVGLNG